MVPWRVAMLPSSLMLMEVLPGGSTIGCSLWLSTGTPSSVTSCPWASSLSRPSRV